MVYSASSSLADDYYNYTADDLTPTESSTADAYYLQHDDSRDQLPQHSDSLSPEPAHRVERKVSLANIAVPSFSAFRSQASSIPAYSPTKTSRHTGTFLASPRPTSSSVAEQPSPRLAEPSSRPYSLGSPLLQQPNGLANVPSPPSTVGNAGDRCVMEY
jgi:hypothetical protein